LEWKKEVLRSLIEPNLGKDILALARIEKPALLRQLFELGCAYSGQIVSMTKLLVQLKDAGNTTTLTHYLLLLKATGLLCGLEKFSQHKIRQRAAPPKLQVLNTAFLTVYCGLTYEEAQRDTRFWGHLVESAVGAHLLNTADLDLTVGYWRESPFEVDFVITQGQRIAALEVKSSKPKSGAGRGLEKFSQQNLHLAVRTHLVGGNDEALALALETPAADWLRT
jgi:predicted AAA+ superfamily ATPase